MNMIAIRILCLLLCECVYFVIVNSQPTVDESSGQCPWNNEENVLQTFQQTCGPTQQLLHRHEQLLKQVSAQLMTTKCPPSNTTERDVDEKGGSTQQLLMEVKRSCENMSGSSPEQQYTHQLLMQIKQSVDNMSAELMTSKCPQSNTTETVMDEKKLLVSSLTGKSSIHWLTHPTTPGVGMSRSRINFCLIRHI